MLDPPRDPVAGTPLRPSAFVGYANGSDPSGPGEYVNAMSGRMPWGAVVVDSSVMQPTTYCSSGDPVSGSGWVQSYPQHPHTILSMGPCQLSPGDTLNVLVALAVGQGSDELSGITDLRATVREAKRYWEAGFTNVAPLAPAAIRAWPNPANVGATFAYSVGASPTAVELSVLDLAGRQIRSWPSQTETPGSHLRVWDGNGEDGRPVRPGLYLLRARVGGEESVARIMILR